MLKVVDFLLIALLTAWGTWAHPQREVVHHIEVLHQGISLTEPIACTLIEVQDEQGQPEQFYMEVPSVVCGDSRCRVDQIRIWWDKFGHFNRFELPIGVELEKNEGENFTPRDYEKLQRLLADEQSSLKDVYKHEVVSTISGEGVDGMTGATVLIDKATYVEGAVWTCYSLWHWSQGETKGIISNITGDAMAIDELYAHLSEPTFQAFAMKQLQRREDYTEATVEVVLKVSEANSGLVPLSLPYWERSPSTIYERALHRLLTTAKTKTRLLLLAKIKESERELSTDFFNRLNWSFPSLSFHEIHVLLQVLAAKQMGTGSISSQLLPLLSADNFIIARRVYWYLDQQDLPELEQKKVVAFYQKNKDRL